MFMATKSILKNIVIKDKRLTRNLIFALENSRNKKHKDVKLTKPYHEIKRNEIKHFLEEIIE